MGFLFSPMVTYCGSTRHTCLTTARLATFAPLENGKQKNV